MEQVRRAFEAALPGGGEIAPDLSARVTLSENTAQYLLVEEVRRGDESQVWMAGWKRSHAPGAAAPPVALEKKLLWEQDEPILDVAFAGAAMVVLTPTGATVYDQAGEGWKPRQAVRFTPLKPWPRDVRGHLRVTGNRIQALLPGWACEGPVEPALDLQCGASEEPWVLESGGSGILLASFTADRNYFDGRIVTQNGMRKTVPPFYSAAVFQDQGSRFWVLALVDGRSQIFDSGLEPLSSISGWGSGVAGTSARCAGGSQVLATRSGDAGEADAVQAFSIVNRTALPLAPPVTLPGPVTALWHTAANSALAVTHDAVTGQYAAYALTMVCGP